MLALLRVNGFACTFSLWRFAVVHWVQIDSPQDGGRARVLTPPGLVARGCLAQERLRKLLQVRSTLWGAGGGWANCCDTQSPSVSGFHRRRVLLLVQSTDAGDQHAEVRDADTSMLWLHCS